MASLRIKLTTSLLLLSILLAACQANLLSPTPATTSPTAPPAAQTPTIPTPKATESTATVIPTMINIETARQDFSMLEKELISGVDWYILIQNANTGEILSERNAETPFPPASMIKIPTAMAVLSILEDQGRTLEELKTNGINGRNFDSLLEAMVVRSEESATDALEYFARGDNQLREKLDAWGLTNTKYDPRTSTASELISSLKLLKTGVVLNEVNTNYLLNLMGVFTENDQILLGRLNNLLPECEFLNKRGTMLNPTIVADMGILKCGEQSWYLVVASTPAAGSTATFEDIQASIESFALEFASLVESQVISP